MKKKNNRPTDVDDENPEWTRADFKKARPLKEVDPELYAMMAKRRGQRGPQKAAKKVPVSLRLKPAIVEGFRKGGPGWQSRMEASLQKALEEGQV